MLRRVVCVVALSLLALPAVAAAAPPATGERAPNRQVPTNIGDGHVGPVIVGPRSYCAPTETGGAIRCADVTRSACRMWKRIGGEWRPGRVVYNDSDEIFFTGPYGRSYQWVWNWRSGYGVMATKCLYRFEPLYA